MPLQFRGASPATTTRARRLRKVATEAEKRLWNQLKDRRLAGWKFVRQAPIGPYFADFLCREARVVVEVDGGQHSGSLHDIRRDATMARAGYRVIRFWNAEVLGSMESVLEGILAALPPRQSGGVER